jgi:hypothetical protein
MMMKPCQTLSKTKGKKKRNGVKKETRDLEQSPGKQTAQQRQATKRKGNHFELNPPPVT